MLSIKLLIKNISRPGDNLQFKSKRKCQILTPGIDLQQFYIEWFYDSFYAHIIHKSIVCAYQSVTSMKLKGFTYHAPTIVKQPIDTCTKCTTL